MRRDVFQALAVFLVRTWASFSIDKPLMISLYPTSPFLAQARAPSLVAAKWGITLGASLTSRSVTACSGLYSFLLRSTAAAIRRALASPGESTG